MKRAIYDELLNWKNKATHKPLILNGARQFGKTYIIREFGENEYTKLAFFSLDRNQKVREIKVSKYHDSVENSFHNRPAHGQSWICERALSALRPGNQCPSHGHRLNVKRALSAHRTGTECPIIGPQFGQHISNNLLLLAQGRFMRIS